MNVDFRGEGFRFNFSLSGLGGAAGVIGTFVLFFRVHHIRRRLRQYECKYVRKNLDS